MFRLLVRGVSGLAICLCMHGLLWGQEIIHYGPIQSTPVYQSPAPVYGTPVYGTPVYGTPVYGSPVQSVPVQSQPIYNSTSSHVHHDGCSHPHDPCNWSSGKDCGCKCKTCLDCYHIHMSKHCCKVHCDNKPLSYNPIGKIPTMDEDVHCYRRHWDFTAPVEVPYIVCKKETCIEVAKRPFTCLPGCEFSLCVPVKECVKKEVTCDLRKKEMDIKVYERHQDGRTSYDVYVINADSGPKHAGGMPKKWLIFHCATPAQIKAELPGITIAKHTKREGTKIAEGDLSHPNPDAAKKIEIRYFVEKAKKEAETATKTLVKSVPAPLKRVTKAHAPKSQESATTANHASGKRKGKSNAATADVKLAVATKKAVSVTHPSTN